MRQSKRLSGLFSALLLVGCAMDPVYDGEVVGEVEQEIISGTVQAGGAQEGRGVVRVDSVVPVGARNSSCTGQLLANQYVLTARHCIRENLWTTDPATTWVASPNTNITVTHERSSGDQVSGAIVVLEGPAAFPPENDYALLRLDAPFEMSGSSSNWWQHIHSGTASSLNGALVTCFGYGLGFYAVPPGPGQPGVAAGGAGTLRSAFLTIDDSNSTSFRVMANGSGQVPANGDSGGPCYFGNLAVGIVSGPGGPVTLIESDGTGGLSAWDTTNIPSALYVAPEAYRAPVQAALQSPAPNVTFQFVPPLPSSSTVVNATTSTPAGSIVDSTGTGTVTRTFQPTVQAVRSGSYSITLTEPLRYMCRRLRNVVPVTGNVPAQSGRCLSDGLLPIIL